MKLVCLSDTHSLHRRLVDIPEGDVLIHAGDSLGQGTLDNLEDLNDWLGELPHRHKIVIAGNHDWAFQEIPELARATLTNALYLEDSGVEIEGSGSGDRRGLQRFWTGPLCWSEDNPSMRNGSKFPIIRMFSSPMALPKALGMKSIWGLVLKMLAVSTFLLE